MKKIIFAFLLVAFLQNMNVAKAEIIDVHDDEKAFGDWKVFCEVDDMMNIAHCKIASKFYDNTAVLTIQPTTKFANQFFIIIPQVQQSSFVTMRVDQNDVVLSRNVGDKDFGLIPFTSEQKNTLFLQMKKGESLFLRFNVRDSEKEITVKLNLKDFRSALAYYQSRTSK